MCTYHIALDDELLARVKPAFGSDSEISAWMQKQVETMLLQMAVNAERTAPPRIGVSQRLRGVAKAPADFDYKKELYNRY